MLPDAGGPSSSFAPYVVPIELRAVPLRAPICSLGLDPRAAVRDARFATVAGTRLRAIRVRAEGHFECDTDVDDAEDEGHSWDGPTIPANVGADAVRILSAAWGIEIREVPHG